MTIMWLEKVLRELLQKETDLEVVGEAVDGEEAVKLVKALKPDVAIKLILPCHD